MSNQRLSPPKMTGSQDFEPIWQIGVFDAHCHPTDIMDSIQRIPQMKARALTVMSTRGQDQDLVEQTAHKIGIRGIHDLKLDATDTGLNSDQSVNHQTRDYDQKRFIVPAFGWHPWFSHLIFDDSKGAVDADEHYRSVLNIPPNEAFLRSLQKPIALSDFLKETEQRLARYPTALIGEVGLDRSFRIPEGPSGTAADLCKKTGGDEGEYTPGSREGRPLTPYKVNMEQQKMILKAQLELAAKHNRAVSVHSVQAHGVVFEVMQSLWKGHERPSKREQKKRRDAANAIEPDHNHDDNDEKRLPFPPRICMHSFSGPAETLKMFLDPKIPADIYVSFSECINFSSPASKKAVEAIRLVPEDKILVESDLHCAGNEMDKLLESIIRRVCEIREWDLQTGAKILRKNWLRFIFGE